MTWRGVTFLAATLFLGTGLEACTCSFKTTGDAPQRKPVASGPSPTRLATRAAEAIENDDWATYRTLVVLRDGGEDERAKEFEEIVRSGILTDSSTSRLLQETMIGGENRWTVSVARKLVGPKVLFSIVFVRDQYRIASASIEKGK
ncbi:MAG: hypothetical protein KC416_17345 [Myxococcales bacterium]|nr:hypothetical protein [Myxococcales bacterium]